MRMVLRITTCFLIGSFFSLHSMQDPWSSLRLKCECSDREIWDVLPFNNYEGYSHDYWSEPLEDLLEKFMERLVQFHEYNKTKKKGEKKRMFIRGYLARATNSLDNKIRNDNQYLESNRGLVCRFYKLAKMFIEYYKPSKSQLFKQMGGKRFRVVGDGEKIEIFSKSCIAPTAVRYNPGSEEEALVTQFNSSMENYECLAKIFAKKTEGWRPFRAFYSVVNFFSIQK